MRIAAALLALLTATVVHADEEKPVVVLAPEMVAPPPLASGLPADAYAPPHRSAGSTAMIAAGGALLGIAAVSGLSAVGLGLSSFLKDFCGYDNGGEGCDATFKQADREHRAAIGLGVTAAVSVAIGIPLLVTGVASGKRDMRLSAAPMLSSGGGASASFSMRF